MKKRVYRIPVGPTGAVRLVKAPSREDALLFVFPDHQATIPTKDQLIALLLAGVVVEELPSATAKEKAAAEDAEPKAEK